MLSTTILIGVLLATLIVSAVLWAVFLRLGLRWAKVAGVTIRRVALGTALVMAVQIAVNMSAVFLSTIAPTQALLLAVLHLAALVIAAWMIIAWMFQAPFLRAAKAWLPTLVPSVGMMLLAAFLIKPFFYDAFAASTNAMAPTLLGNHWRGVCPECGEPNYCSPAHAHFGPAEPPKMICTNFHVTTMSDIDEQVHSGDHFLVANFLTPRRWDLAVFQFPGNPSALYVKRLVGLPGETIHIEDGAVWANGGKLTPPDSLRGIQYMSELPDGHFELWGTKDRPAVLADDEFFVLGDFSAQSADSRYWEQGVPGHNPYAVPQSHMKGVVTHIHWPPRRWRILR
jgi:signal peptidase I